MEINIALSDDEATNLFHTITRIITRGDGISIAEGKILTSVRRKIIEAIKKEKGE